VEGVWPIWWTARRCASLVGSRTLGRGACELILQRLAARGIPRPACRSSFPCFLSAPAPSPPVGWRGLPPPLASS